MHRTIPLLIGLGAGCGSVVGGQDTVEVGECAGEADVDDTTLIAYELESSAHEMIVCGSLTFQLIGAVLESAHALVGDPASAPDGFGYADGTYTTTGVGVAMDLTLLYGPSTPGGTAGEPLGVDVFDPDSWLVGATVSEQGEDWVVTFDAPGPLAPLLGMGDAPSSPLVLTDADLNEVVETLGGLRLDTTILVDDVVETSTITYAIDNAPAALADILTDLALDMDSVEGATGAREDLGQAATTPVWDVVYVDGAVGALEGTIVAEVRGGPFDFQATYTYLPTDPDPNILIECL